MISWPPDDHGLSGCSSNICLVFHSSFAHNKINVIEEGVFEGLANLKKL